MQSIRIVSVLTEPRLQLISALSSYLPTSPYYATLSALPPPDPTKPSATTTFDAQNAIHNGFSVLDEIVRLTEHEEEETLRKEVEKRRMRLGAGTPEEVRNEVVREVSGSSTVCLFLAFSLFLLWIVFDDDRSL